ncbi:MAG: WecB/TagA/CpsF family glycosyltransferase [Candidatus Pacebacteria bacterium]|nr:WecB/TagA/CpsF family glycosyltransferase [Candidatus Paceibacterota bacterium]
MKLIRFPKLSVVICTRKRSGLLRCCLASIRAQARLPDEVIVVSSGCLGEDPAVIKEYPDLPIKHFWESQKGIPFARNRCLKEAHGEIIVFIDDDCLMAADHLEKTILAHRHYPQAAAIQGQSLNGRPENIYARMLHFYYRAWFGSGFLKKGKKEMTILDTKNVSFKKKLIRDLKFDSFWTPYFCGEDVDFAFRMRKNNLKVIYQPTIKVRHQEKNNLIGFLKSRFKHGRVSVALSLVWPEEKIVRQGREKLSFLIGFLKKFPRHWPCFLSGKAAYALGRLRERLFIKQRLSVPNKQDFYPVPVCSPGNEVSRVRILNLAVDRVTTSQVLERVEKIVSRRKGKKTFLIFTPNVDHLMLLRKDQEFCRAYQKADLVVADGMPLVWASRFLKSSLPERVNGANLAERILALAAEKGRRIGLAGSSPETISQAIENLSKKYPGLKIGFYREGGQFDILLACHGGSKQEKWLAARKNKLKIKVALGVGSAIEFWAGNLKRAPVWLQRVGLEWLFRLKQEPRRLWRRYLIRDIKFPFLLTRQILGQN